MSVRERVYGPFQCVRDDVIIIIFMDIFAFVIAYFTITIHSALCSFQTLIDLLFFLLFTIIVFNCLKYYFYDYLSNYLIIND